jgi:hypothetical protein
MARAFILSLMFVFVAGSLRAQEGDRLPPPPPPPQDSPMLRSDSWDLPVNKACVVDTVTVKAPHDFATENFTTPARVGEDQIAANRAARDACKKAADQCKKDLARKAWREGNALCAQHIKGEDVAQERPRACKAIRGNLKLGDIADTGCTYSGTGDCGNTNRTRTVTADDGVEHEVRIRECKEWRARATCKAPDVEYVCDP